MRPMKTVVVLFILSGFALGQQAQKTEFPSDNDILQLLDHVDGLVTVFKGSITEQESQFKRDYTDDKKVISDIQQVSAKVRKYPQGFNSAAGYLVVRYLFAIVQSELTCSTETLNKSVLFLMAGKTDTATALTRLATGCSETAIFAKTVMDTADSLYSRAALATDDLKNRAYDAAIKCGEALKRSEAARKQNAH